MSEELKECRVCREKFPELVPGTIAPICDGCYKRLLSKIILEDIRTDTSIIKTKKENINE